MKIPSNNAKLILIFSIFGFLAGLYLFSVERINQDFQHNKQWTAVYLTNPQEQLLNFAIENYEGETTTYEYALVAEESQEAILRESIELLPGEKKEIEFGEEQKGEEIIIKYGKEEIILKKPGGKL